MGVTLKLSLVIFDVNQSHFEALTKINMIY